MAPPEFESIGSRATTYVDLKGLAADSSNIVIAEATGQTREVPLPDFATNPHVESPPNVMVTVTITDILSGSDIATNSDIEVVAFGVDTDGAAPLATPGRYLVFLAPYLFIEPDRPPVTVPAQPGGIVYTIVGGPAGIFYQAIDDQDDTFVKVDKESPRLPESITPDEAALPTGWTDEQYVATGGPFGNR